MAINTNGLNILRYTMYTPIYDLLGVILNRSRKFSFQHFEPNPGDKVLIVGAGTGLDLYFIPKNLAITAVDITPSMIAVLKNRAQRLQMNVDAQVMDGQKLTFADNSFDYIVLHAIIAVIPDPFACIKEAERVLKVGGSILVYDKFLKPGKKPSILRKFVNLFTNVLFSNINRSIDTIIMGTKLVKIVDIPRELGVFRFVKLVKTA